MKNKTVKIFCAIIYSITALAGFVFAAIYIFRPEFMPYHAVAVGKEWAEMSSENQVLILALMRVGGGGWLATSVGILLLLLIPFRTNKFWPYLGIPAIGLSALIPTFSATLFVKLNSPATPPYLVAAILIVLLLITIVMSLIYKNRA
ncbi:MAG: hypothetical protein ABFS05_10555 [Bacteroidota bacterium]